MTRYRGAHRRARVLDDAYTTALGTVVVLGLAVALLLARHLVTLMTG